MARDLPERVEHLERLSDDSTNWQPIEQAIRPELRGPYIEKARKAANAGLWDAAVLYFWNETMNDLRSKVATYGIEYFPLRQGKQLTEVESLRDHVNDHDLVEGCYQLGIISREAWFYLQKCREIRNYDSAAHLSDSQLDPFEAQNFIKNCVKYVLCYDPPSPGFSIRDFFERLRQDDISEMQDEVLTAITDQAPEIRKAILKRMFKEYTDINCPPLTKDNIEVVAPSTWELVDTETKNELGQSYVRVRTGSNQESALLAFQFFKLVKGLGAIPAAYRRPIYEKPAEQLIKVHFEADNFYKEPKIVNALVELGNEVPKEAASTYAKAVLLSYLGNSYGYSIGAASANGKMISDFNLDCIRAMIELFRSDNDVIVTLTSSKPIKRLKSLVELLPKRSLTPAQERVFLSFRDDSESAIQKHFMDLSIGF